MYYKYSALKVKKANRKACFLDLTKLVTFQYFYVSILLTSTVLMLISPPLLTPFWCQYHSYKPMFYLL